MALSEYLWKESLSVFLLLERAGILAGTVSPGMNFRGRKDNLVSLEANTGAWLGADGLHGGLWMTWALGLFLGKSSNNNNNSNNNGCYSVQRMGRGSSDRGFRELFQGYLWASLEHEK